MKRSVITKKLARVDKALDQAIEKAEIPGAVVLARMPREGEWLEHESVRGLAVLRPERIPMTRETIFDLASLTKPIATTTAILLLVHDGILNLEDPVSKHLPVFSERDKDGVTIRHLLTHSSGLKPWRPFHEELIERDQKKTDRLIGTPQAREWILERIFKSKLVHETGQAAVYGDLDFIVLGALIEAVTHQSLEEFCQERVFHPLGMKNTRFVPIDAEGMGMSAAERRGVAATENCPWRDRIIWGVVHDPNAFMMGGVAGHAGLFSSADDILLFAQTLMDVWHGRSDALPQDLLREFLKRQEIPENSDWTLGWDTPTPGQSSSGQYFSRNSVGHLGFTGTSLWMDLDQEAIIVMLTNRVHLVAKKSGFSLRPKIHDLIMESFLVES